MIAVVTFETPPPSCSSAEAEAVIEELEEDAGKGFTFPGPATNDAKLVEEMYGGPGWGLGDVMD